MAWLVIVCQPYVKYRRIVAVGKSICNHRRNLSVGNYGMTGNCLATLCEISTDNWYIRWYVFKIYIKNNLLIVKNLNKQIKMD
jgi:hypothetical protein